MSEDSARASAVEIESVELDPEAEEILDRRPAVRALDLPRLLGNVLGDIRTIAEGMATLPRLLTALNSIESKVEVLNDEVHKMRTRVDSMADDVGDVRGGIDRLEPHLEDMTKVVHPLRRIGERARRRELDPDG
ncbi:MAG TPA: hypothetical protein VHF58_10060 [Solirubrobacterales bacterium]|nr:hypothetical protein [Solirubrobacterales bacterium]